MVSKQQAWAGHQHEGREVGLKDWLRCGKISVVTQIVSAEGLLLECRR